MPVDAAPPDLRRVLAALASPDAWACDPEQVARLRGELSEATLVERSGETAIMRGDRLLGVVRPYGSVVLYVAPIPAPAWPTPGFSPLWRPLTVSARQRLLELDRGGRVTLAIQRDRQGALREAWVRNMDGALLGVLPGGAQHPLWGASDRLVRPPVRSGTPPERLTICGAVSWDGIAAIPPLADPTRLPPGAGTGILNVLAALASDQQAVTLRYRGPFPTEQLFWALCESFRVETDAADPVAAFTEGAEEMFARGESREVPLDWTPAPHERLFLPDGVYVQLRDGVEKVFWDGRVYHRVTWQGLRRRGHRVIRASTEPDGRPAFVAGVEALGRPLEDHLVLDARGALLRRPAGALARPAEQPEVPLAEPWREALGWLLLLEATPLLSTAIATVWGMTEVVWGAVPLDLIDARGASLRLARALVEAYGAEHTRTAADARRALAQRLVGDVLDLLGPPIRRA
ncbi:MAG: hypothetical protein HYV62_10600, partial [Candidatus Rokubacteria bacterium]|nr:hypothetical protein [Candidatus Rokubacteria bacterium]